MKKQNFVHLHCHDEYSLLDGFGKPEMWAERASKLGFEYLAITNHGNIDGAIKFQSACDNNNIKALIGAELYIVPDITIKEKGEKRFHITLLVKNNIGWQNLLKMITISNIEGFYHRPRVSPEILLKHCEGLVVMTACASSFIQTEWGMELFLNLKELIKDDLYLEIMPIQLSEQKVVNKLCIDLHKKLNVPLVATNDCHYVKESDNFLQEVLLAIQSKKKWNDPKRWKFDIDDLYLKTKFEMIKSFKEQDAVESKYFRAAISNTLVIADKCKDFRVEQIPVSLPQVPQFKGQDDNVVLHELCMKGFDEKIIGKNKNFVEYQKRYEEEFETITRQGFARYFLIVWELVDWCEKNNIMVGPGRGSSGGSLICYLLNITKIDPIEFKLIFARFISPARIDLPDIDMDFEDIKRPLIRKHLEEVYGEWSVAGVSTFSTMKGRGALRDASRVFDVPLVDVNKASAAIVVRSGGDVRSDYTIEDAFKTFEDGIKFAKKYPEVSKTAMGIEGQIRGKGQHAAAIIIADEDLREGKRTAFALGKEKEHMTNWDKYDIEYVGLMKLDVLGLNSLTILNETRRLVKENKGVDINFEELSLDDEKCYEEFTKGNNIGCFQVGSLGLRRFCQQLGVEDFDMLVHATSLYRPGTLRSGMTTEFVMRKKGESSWESVHPILDDLTKDTLGIILYQEQVMRFMYDLGGLGWRTADTVRKVISKSQGEEQFMKFKDMFADGCEEKGTLDRETAEQMWDELASFGSYCLAGDTKIYRSSSNQHKGIELTLKEAFEYQKSSNFKHRKLKILSMSDDEYVRPHTINRIVYSGRKEVFLIRTISNKMIKATQDHRFIINNRWKQLKNAKVGDYIKVCDIKLKNKSKATGHGSGWAKISPRFRKGKGATNEEKKQIEKLKIKYNGKCQKCRSDKNCEMHHIDGDHSNNKNSNTMWLCRKCHKAEYPSETFQRFQDGYYTCNEKIVEIFRIGVRETYDVEMTSEPRNFIANGFVSHNSFNLSHAVEYSLISYWDMWCKVHYPEEFICANLTHGNDDKKEEMIEEAFRLGIDVRPPKLGKSKPKEWVIVDNVLYTPFIEIKGIGDKTADAFVNLKNNTQKGFYVPEGKKKIGKKFLNILTEIKGDVDEPLTDEEAIKIDDYFKFSYLKDKLFKFRGLIDLLNKGLNFFKICDVDFRYVDKEYKYYFGEMTEVKFGYRSSVEKLDRKKMKNLKGQVGDLGGVYGNFIDGSDFCMLIFGSEIYKKKKGLVEHCTGELLIAKANVPSRAGSLHCIDSWHQEELFNCELEGLNLDLIKSKRFVNKDLLECNECSLSNECDHPILPSKGKYNIMIIGEAPGRDEDRIGKGFVGKSGKLVWEVLEKEGFDRKDFNITNVVKCYPSKSKTPGKREIKKCSKWLEEEIEKIKPPIVLAFGNTSIKFFTEEDSGIMKKNGTTEWNEKYGMWICWCIHPASVLYHRENKELFKKGIKNFTKKIKYLKNI